MMSGRRTTRFRAEARRTARPALGRELDHAPCASELSLCESVSCGSAEDSATNREQRAAEIRAAYERGERKSKETAVEMAARNAAYLAQNQWQGHKGRKLLPETWALHSKFYREKKPWRQCFEELYAEGFPKPLPEKIVEVERRRRNDAKGYEKRLKGRIAGGAG